MQDDDLVDVVGQITATSDKIRQRASSTDAADEMTRTLAEVETTTSGERGRVEVTVRDSAVTRLALSPEWLATTDALDVERAITATVNACLKDYQEAVAAAMREQVGPMNGLFDSLKSLDARLDAAYDRAMTRIDSGEVIW